MDDMMRTESKANNVHKSLKIILVAVISAGILLVVVRSAASYLLGGLRMASQSSAIASLQKLNECAAKYSANHPGAGYPSSLSLMGSKEEHCIDAELEDGIKIVYRFTYSPGPAKEKEPIKTYTVDARPIDFGCTKFDIACTGFSSLFSDESGTLHLTREDRPATSRDPTIE